MGVMGVRQTNRAQARIVVCRKSTQQQRPPRAYCGHRGSSRGEASSASHPELTPHTLSHQAVHNRTQFVHRVPRTEI